MLIYLIKFVHTRKEIHGKQVYMAYGEKEIIYFVDDILYNTKEKHSKNRNKKVYNIANLFVPFKIDVSPVV